MSDLAGGNKNFFVFTQTQRITYVDIAGVEAVENFAVYYEPPSYFTAGNSFVQFYPVYCWTPIYLTEARQLYEDWFAVEWTRYIETEYSEFAYYEVHRSAIDFIPVPGDGATLIATITDNATLKLLNQVPDKASQWWYAVIVMLDDGRYSVTDALEAQHVPVWDTWPDNILIHNNGGDTVSQQTQYSCECAIATDPEGATPVYYFQYCATYMTSGSTPWYFVYGANPFPRFVDCHDRNVIINSAAQWGVRVNGELWTCVGDTIAHMATYGPNDKVYIHDRRLNFIVFGDGTHGKVPAPSHQILVNFSWWIDIATESEPTLKEQDWDVGEIYVGADYRMRVFAADSITDGNRSYAAIGASSFRVMPPIEPPMLVYPLNQSVVAVYRPTFSFYGIAPLGGNLKYKLEVASDSAFENPIQSFDMDTEYPSGQMVSLRPPIGKEIFNPDAKIGPYWWRVRLTDIETGATSRWSRPFSFTIEGGTFRWRIGLRDAEVPFIPEFQGWGMKTEQIGREKAEKHVFTCKFAPMKQAKMEALRAEFRRHTALSLYDHLGDRYDVYWGECERALSGHAHFPDRPLFGIEPLNYIHGALRWSGTAVFTEI